MNKVVEFNSLVSAKESKKEEKDKERAKYLRQRLVLKATKGKYLEPPKPEKVTIDIDSLVKAIENLDY